MGMVEDHQLAARVLPREPKGASVSGLTSEELATSEEGRHRLRAPGGKRDSRASGNSATAGSQAWYSSSATGPAGRPYPSRYLIAAYRPASVPSRNHRAGVTMSQPMTLSGRRRATSTPIAANGTAIARAWMALASES